MKDRTNTIITDAKHLKHIGKNNFLVIPQDTFYTLHINDDIEFERIICSNSTLIIITHEGCHLYCKAIETSGSGVISYEEFQEVYLY